MVVVFYSNKEPEMIRIEAFIMEPTIK